MLALGAGVAWAIRGDIGALVLRLTFDFGAAILLFLSGVRRGLSFRSPEGPTMAQRAAFFWLFALGLLALTLPFGPWLVALGFGSVALLDWRAARIGDAPPYFARLRPLQMTIAALSMIAVAVLNR